MEGEAQMQPARRTLGRFALLRLLPALILVISLIPAAPASADDLCAKRYVAGGDDIPAGQDVNEDERYPNKLRVDHLNQPAPGHGASSIPRRTMPRPRNTSP